MSINIVDKNLSRIIKMKLCTDESANIEDIEEICIEDMSLMQKKLNIDLTEIVKLKKLKSISLKFFEINDSVINSLNELEFLEEIEFLMCTFNTENTITRNIKSLDIYNCTGFNFNIIKNITDLEELYYVHSGLVNISNLNVFKKLRNLKISYCNIVNFPKLASFESLEKLYLNDVTIDFDIDIKNMKNLKFISLSGSKVNNKEKYIKMLSEQNKNLIIEFKENSLPIE